MKTFSIKFFENRKMFFGISLGIILIGLICNIVFGARLDIQFTGGAVIKYSYTGDVQQEEVEKLYRIPRKRCFSAYP